MFRNCRKFLNRNELNSSYSHFLCQAKCFRQLFVPDIWNKWYSPTKIKKPSTCQYFQSPMVTDFRSSLPRIWSHHQSKHCNLFLSLRKTYFVRFWNNIENKSWNNSHNRERWNQIHTEIRSLYEVIEYRGRFAISGTADILERETYGF